MANLKIHPLSFFLRSREIPIYLLYRRIWFGMGWKCNEGVVQDKRRTFTFSPNSTNEPHFRKPRRNPPVCVAKCLVLSGYLGFWNSDLHTKWKTKQRANEEALIRRGDMEMELFTSAMNPSGRG